MTDPDIKPGDVAIDLVERGKVYVLARTADSVEAHREREGFDLATYKSHPLIHVSDDDPVFECVYLPQNPTVELGKHYDFPASRLARVPVENADESQERIQDELAVQLSTALLAVYDTTDGADGHRLEIAIEEVLGSERASLVFELQDVDERFGGGDGD